MTETLRYGHSLYKQNPTYEVHLFKTHDEWLEGRKNLKGIGGSDSASAIGQSKWRSNYELWLIKTGREASPDLSNNPYVRYGSMAEEYIRRIYQLDREDAYEVQYKDNCILRSIEYPWMLYSPDGLLLDKRNGKKGIFEAKTANAVSPSAFDNWLYKIPQQYYIQVLHGLAVTGFDFVEVRAHLKRSDELAEIRTYHIERSEVKDDIAYIVEKTKEFCSYVEQDKEPPTIIKGIGDYDL